jgi:hypothetical protein
VLDTQTWLEALYYERQEECRMNAAGEDEEEDDDDEEEAGGEFSPPEKVTGKAGGMPGPEDEEEWLDRLRQSHGEAWVQANMARLKDEWAYLMSL